MDTVAIAPNVVKQREQNNEHAVIDNEQSFIDSVQLKNLFYTKTCTYFLHKLSQSYKLL